MEHNSCRRLYMALILAVLLPTSVKAFTDQIPWGVDRIRANLVWNTNAGNGIKIAVIDTGVVDADYYPHPDINASISNGTSFVYGAWYIDEINHGTLVAGIVAAIINDFGLVGVSPNVSIIVAKAISPTTEYPDDIVDALYWCQRNEVQIIVMSFGYTTSAQEFEDACYDLFWNYGILLVAAAGNAGAPIDLYPALYDTVIAVGAVDRNDNRWSASNYGPELELMAPGVQINSTANFYAYPFTAYMEDDGTSFSAPHVAGAAALVYASKVDPEFDILHDGRWDASDVRFKLWNSSLDLGDSGKDNYYGFGLVNAYYASQTPLGDINGDHKVNILDIVQVALHYGSKEGEPNWNPRADENIDKQINIIDIVKVAIKFGKSA